MKTDNLELLASFDRLDEAKELVSRLPISIHFSSFRNAKARVYFNDLVIIIEPEDEGVLACGSEKPTKDEYQLEYLESSNSLYARFNILPNKAGEKPRNVNELHVYHHRKRKGN